MGGVNKLTKLGRCVIRVHFAKISFGKIHLDDDDDNESGGYCYGGFRYS